MLAYQRLQRPVLYFVENSSQFDLDKLPKR